MSRYIRKTRDVHVVQVHYCATEGWEDVGEHYTRRDARTERKEYRENAPEYPVRIIRRREAIV